MARRRLHGATQKKRKKTQTRELKRQSSVKRVRATQQPAPFQRTGELSPQDIAFLEEMRRMGVRGSLQPGETPLRRESFEMIRQTNAGEEGALFQAAMADLGVTSLGEKEKKHPKGKPPAKIVSHQASSQKPPVAAPFRQAPPSLHSVAGHPREGAPSAVAPPPQHKEKPPTPPEPTIFEMEGDSQESMATLMSEYLEQGGFDPARKYEGAPRPKPARALPVKETPFDPDAELDLHGKTQEQAIRMVQNFLLTSSRQKLREVIIVTGKGINSGPGGPVLRAAVYGWLERNGERFSREFGPAPAEHGGEGAIRVVLR